MKKNKIQNIILMILLAIICTGVIIFSENQSENQNIIAQTITPQVMTITQKKVISGNLYPIKEIEVKSTVSGTLETYYVQIGDFIKAGNKIAKIKMLPEPLQVENARTNLNTTRIAFENDRSNYKRDSVLFKNGVISRSDFETISRTYLTSKEQYESAKNQLHLLEDGYIPKSNISNVITATTDGTIIDLPVEEGMPVTERNTFREGSTIALIARLDSFIFKGKVVETDVLELKKGMKIKVSPSSRSDFETDAVIRKSSSKGHLDEGIMKYDIEAILTLPDSIPVFSGFNATAEFVVREKNDVLAIPERCILFDEDSTFVNILAKDKFEKRKIRTGISDGIMIEIIKGISKNDRIKSKIE